MECASIAEIASQTLTNFLGFKIISHKIDS
jgi:hypothetical protein